MGGKYAQLADRLNAAANDSAESKEIEPWPNVTGLIVTVFADYLQMLWEWPEGAHAAWACCRIDERYPKAPGERGSIDWRIGRGQYEQDGGLRMSLPEPGVYRVVVFAVYRNQGREVSSSGQTSVCRKEGIEVRRRTEVRYQIKKSMLPTRKRVKVVLDSDEPVKLGDMLLVARAGTIQPENVSDGTVVALVIGGALSSDTTLDQTVDLSDVASPSVLRLFFSDESGYASARLVDPAERSRRI
jgi:hypothetical protein